LGFIGASQRPVDGRQVIGGRVMELQALHPLAGGELAVNDNPARRHTIADLNPQVVIVHSGEREVAQRYPGAKEDLIRSGALDYPPVALPDILTIRLVPIAPLQEVAAAAARQGVIAIPAKQVVVTSKAVKRIVPVHTVYRITS